MLLDEFYEKIASIMQHCTDNKNFYTFVSKYNLPIIKKVNSKKYTFLNNFKDKTEDFVIDFVKRVIQGEDNDELGNLLNKYTGNFYIFHTSLREKLLTNLEVFCATQKKVFTDILDKLYFLKTPQGSLKNINTILDKNFIIFLEEFVQAEIFSSSEKENLITILNHALQNINHSFTPTKNKYNYIEYKIVLNNQNRVSSEIKNIIFASNGLKPEIVITDALNNQIEIVKNREYCLVYNRPIDIKKGLTWGDLVDWWCAENQAEKNSTSSSNLKDRLFSSVPSSSPPEQLFWETYLEKLRQYNKRDYPALLPQVYLHLDPNTIKKGSSYLKRQRMDFLLLLPHNVRVVIEIDGVQHYSENDKPMPKKYAEMVAADRELKLAGYELYRFGGYEFNDPENAKKNIATFLDSLFKKHSVM